MVMGGWKPSKANVVTMGTVSAEMGAVASATFSLDGTAPLMSKATAQVASSFTSLTSVGMERWSWEKNVTMAFLPAGMAARKSAQ